MQKRSQLITPEGDEVIVETKIANFTWRINAIEYDIADKSKR